MTSIIYFDYCALIIELLVFSSMYVRKLLRGRINRWLIAMMSMLIVTTIADIVAYTIEGKGIVNIPASFVSNTISLWGTANTSVIFCGYLFAQVGIWHKIKENRWINWLYNVPMILISVMMLLVNPIVHIIFYIDENGVYKRGTIFFFFYFLAIFYIFVGYVVVFKYHKLFSVNKIMSIFLVFILGIVGSIIQIFRPAFIVQNFFTSVSMVVLLFGVQAPEERMHGTTGLFSMNAYVQDINKYRILNNNVGITLSVLSNYDGLIEMLGYFKVQQLIIAVADRLVKWARRNRIDGDIYYLGRGRFAVIVDDRYEDEMLQISQGINSALLESIEIDEMQIKAMFNSCFINFPKDIENPEFLFAFDETLEKEVFSGELRYAERLFDRKNFELARDIAKVIDRAFSDGLFELHYQPVYSVESGRYISAEAFLRLNDPEFGYIAPDLLIKMAERNSSIHAITTYVLDEVCRFISSPEFMLLGLEWVEINLSPIQCMWNDLLAILLSTMKVYGAEARNICFNITDVENVEVYEKMRDNINALAQVGIKVMMDDFGAGIFEIERIAEMPLAGIKIDREFVKSGLTEVNRDIFEGTLKMIEDIGIESVVVGAENETMVKELKEMGCKFLQGYYFLKPVEKKELSRFILME